MADTKKPVFPGKLEAKSLEAQQRAEEGLLTAGPAKVAPAQTADPSSQRSEQELREAEKTVAALRDSSRLMTKGVEMVLSTELLAAAENQIGDFYDRIQLLVDLADIVIAVRNSDGEAAAEKFQAHLAELMRKESEQNPVETAVNAVKQEVRALPRTIFQATITALVTIIVTLAWLICVGKLPTP